MTRNRDLDCRDLAECEHAPIIPVTEGGVIVYWLCDCGKRIDLKPRRRRTEKRPS